ncbi:uncharacterized protein LOC116346781 [Contarinia nasturtii]|uniref:uncharacterized protein LOC116346781 n=1 Tax=Contarinia nasturtii TaxID=265458 RepID=UPI0012D4986F|nr:uncharacterized protein LOC116346781 [Contarinia nasturtii]
MGHKCDFCEYSSKLYNNIQRHIDGVHKKIQHICECGAKLSPSSITRHKKNFCSLNKRRSMNDWNAYNHHSTDNKENISSDDNSTSDIKNECNANDLASDKIFNDDTEDNENKKHNILKHLTTIDKENGDEMYTEKVSRKRFRNDTDTDADIECEGEREEVIHCRTPNAFRKGQRSPKKSFTNQLRTMNGKTRKLKRAWDRREKDVGAAEDQMSEFGENSVIASCTSIFESTEDSDSEGESDSDEEGVLEPIKRRSVNDMPYQRNYEPLIFNSSHIKSNSHNSNGRNEIDFIQYNQNLRDGNCKDPNELCDRLRLLISSKCKTNRKNSQEIVTIIEHLRNSGYIT